LIGGEDTVVCITAALANQYFSGLRVNTQFGRRLADPAREGLWNKANAITIELKPGKPAPGRESQA
jgi:hypothetical protein